LSLLSIDCDIVLLFSEEKFVKKEVKGLRSLELAIGRWTGVESDSISDPEVRLP